MWDMDSNVISAIASVMAVAMVLLTVVGCTSQPSAEQPRDVPLAQKWELQPGDAIAGHQVQSSLGDISIALKGNAVYAPFNGRVQPHKTNCVIFSSEEVPNYLFRLCGINKPAFGSKQAGEAIGTADELHLALLNKQRNGKWAFVEPSKKVVEQMLIGNR